MVFTTRFAREHGGTEFQNSQCLSALCGENLLRSRISYGVHFGFGTVPSANAIDYCLKLKKNVHPNILAYGRDSTRFQALEKYQLYFPMVGTICSNH